MILTRAVDQVSGDEELLDTARDCFRFVTTYFEPINVSAVHIYHSALELSPLSSIVRRVYYHRRHSPFPRVVAGTQRSWDQSSTTRCGGSFDFGSYTWSPCGQFLAVNSRTATEIRDPLTSELLSTLRRPTETRDPPTSELPPTLQTKFMVTSISQLTELNDQVAYSLAYSQDGRSLAAIVATSLIIWDIQTGGVAKEVECGALKKYRLVWSSDGRAIGIIQEAAHSGYSVRVYDVVSGAAQFHHALQSNDAPHLWAHNESFRIMTTGLVGQTWTTDFFEVGSVLTKIESFRAGLLGSEVNALRARPSGSRVNKVRIRTFSPTTYRIAVVVDGQLNIIDVRNWKCLLLKPWDRSESCCFSSDGSLFAATSYREDCVQIWKYGSGQYTAWGKFPTRRIDGSLQFSPDLSSIAGWFPDFLRVWRLDRAPFAHPDAPDPRPPLTVLSQCGTYVVTSQGGGGTVTITNLLSQSPSQFIDTGISYIEVLALTGSVLLVVGLEVTIAWRITEGGVVNGPTGGRRADRGDSLWVIPPFGSYSKLSIQGQTAVMKQDTQRTLFNDYAYHTGTGEELKLAQLPPQPHSHQYWLSEAMHGLHYPHCRSLKESSTRCGNDWPVSWTTLAGGWVKDPERRHRLWIPPAWRLQPIYTGWHRNIETLWFNSQGRTVIVKF